MENRAEYIGRMEFNLPTKNNSEARNKKVIYFNPWVNEIYGWLILIDDSFTIRRNYERKINELAEKFMSYADKNCTLSIKDIFVHAALAKNRGNDLNGKPMIYANLILSDRTNPERPISQKLKLNTMGTENCYPIYISGHDLQDDAMFDEFPELVYSVFSKGLVSPSSRLIDLRRNALQ